MASVAGLVPLMIKGACAHKDKKSLEPFGHKAHFIFMGPTQAPFIIKGPTQALPHIRHEAGCAFRMFMHLHVYLCMYIFASHGVFLYKPQACGVGNTALILPIFLPILKRKGLCACILAQNLKNVNFWCGGSS